MSTLLAVGIDLGTSGLAYVLTVLIGFMIWGSFVILDNLTLTKKVYLIITCAVTLAYSLRHGASRDRAL